ncbi:hypothetical protein QQ045_014480 [Rhodiola kirilowii]
MAEGSGWRSGGGRLTGREFSGRQSCFRSVGRRKGGIGRRRRETMVKILNCHRVHHRRRWRRRRGEEGEVNVAVVAIFVLCGRERRRVRTRQRAIRTARASAVRC